jgi:hypothetical protein
MCRARARRCFLRTCGAGRRAWVRVSVVPGERAPRHRLGRLRRPGESRLRGVRRTRALAPRERASVVRTARRHLPPPCAKNGRRMRKPPPLSAGQLARPGLMPPDRHRRAPRRASRRRRRMDRPCPRHRRGARVCGPLPTHLPATGALWGGAERAAPHRHSSDYDPAGSRRQRPQRKSRGYRSRRSAALAARRNRRNGRGDDAARAPSESRRRIDDCGSGSARPVRARRSLSETGEATVV